MCSTIPRFSGLLGRLQTRLRRVPSITPPSHGFIIDLQVLGNAGVTGCLEGFQDDVSSFDQPLGTRGAAGHLLQQVLLQGADMKQFGLRRGHERGLLHFVLLSILSHPPLLRYFRVAVLVVIVSILSIQSYHSWER